MSIKRLLFAALAAGAALQSAPAIGATSINPNMDQSVSPDISISATGETT